MSDRPTVDELRTRLRELGYLDAGVDRFVLGPVRVGRSLLSVAWRASARIGLLAALLLGPSATVALGVRLPGLVTGVRDALVLAAYLGALFGAGVAVLTLAATLLLGTLASRPGPAARLASRARTLSSAAALVVAGACLVYLVFWWRAVGPSGASSYGSAWTWPVLAIAAATSVLLGHAARLTTLALAASVSGSVSQVPRQAKHPWLPRFGLAALTFGAAAGLLFVLTPRESRRGTEPPAFSASPGGVPVTVVAIDGLDLAYAERLIVAGRIPTLGRLLGGSRASLAASDAPDPARTWTSLATGQSPQVHGISGIERRQVSGIDGSVPSGSSGTGAMIAAATDLVRLTRPALTTGIQRRAKTFWEVASEHGVSSLVVNWWATWPAPPGPGIVLSDRATLRLEIGGDLDAEIAPPGLYPVLRAGWPEWQARARRRILEVFPSDASDQVTAPLRRAADQDASVVALAAHAASVPPALRAVYLPGLDIAQSSLSAGGRGLPASALATRMEALDRYYDLLDSLVQSVVGEAGPDGLVALVTDPGRSMAEGGGVLALSGRAARPGARIDAARGDVMPTLLYALGLPASRELPGRPRTELFSEPFTAALPVRFVETFGVRAVSPRPAGPAPLDREMLERLRSLGYVR